MAKSDSEGFRALKQSGKFCCIRIEPADNGFTIEVQPERPESKEDGPQMMPKPKRFVYDADDIQSAADDVRDLMTKHAGSFKGKKPK